MTEPVIIGSERSEAGLPAGMVVLRDGGSALDAVDYLVAEYHQPLVPDVLPRISRVLEPSFADRADH